MDVSIVIVNWNTKTLLADCLESIYEQTDGVEFEVIVVDNGSSDNSALMVGQRFPEVVLIKNEQNIGYAAANNKGIDIATGRYVLVLNSDIVIVDNAIAETVEFADIHSGAAVVSCKVCNPDNSVQATCFMYPSLLNMILADTYLNRIFKNNKFFGRERMTWFKWDYSFELDVVAGCFMLVRREAIEQVGLMDESFFMYSEETDWCYRFGEANWEVVYTPHTKIIHLGGQSSRQNAPQMILQLRGSVLQFLKKHSSWLEYRLACVLVWVFFVTRIPVWSVVYFLKIKSRAIAQIYVLAYVTGLKKMLTSGALALCCKRN